MTIRMDWSFETFASLKKEDLFTLLKLRIDVFVVEQACAYPELDALDKAQSTLHLLGHAQGELAAYARAMPGVMHETQQEQAIRIGRVVIAPAFRGNGLARELMQQMMTHLDEQYPHRAQCLAAQQSVMDFYGSLGYVAVSGIYLEDGIAHVDMLRPPAG